MILYRMAPPDDYRGAGGRTSRLVALGLPVATAYSLVALEGLTDQSVAARLGTGNAAALAYANRLFLIPIGFVLATVGPIVLGALTASRRRGREEMALASNDQLRTTVRWLASASLAFVAIAPALVSLVYHYGAFTDASVGLTRDAIDGFAIGVPAVTLYLVLFRTMQAIAPLDSSSSSPWLPSR